MTSNVSSKHTHRTTILSRERTETEHDRYARMHRYDRLHDASSVEPLARTRGWHGPLCCACRVARMLSYSISLRATYSCLAVTCQFPACFAGLSVCTFSPRGIDAARSLNLLYPDYLFIFCYHSPCYICSDRRITEWCGFKLLSVGQYSCALRRYQAA